MSIFEYNEEEELKKYGQSVYRSGEIKGKEEGRIEGKAEGKAESVILALEMKGPVPEQLKNRIFSEKDGSLLEDWLKAAIKADTIEAFADRAGLKEK